MMLPSWVVCTPHAVHPGRVCDFCNWISQKCANFKHLIPKSGAACACVYVQMWPFLFNAIFVVCKK